MPCPPRSGRECRSPPGAPAVRLTRRRARFGHSPLPALAARWPTPSQLPPWPREASPARPLAPPRHRGELAPRLGPGPGRRAADRGPVRAAAASDGGASSRCDFERLRGAVGAALPPAWPGCPAPRLFRAAVPLSQAGATEAGTLDELAGGRRDRRRRAPSGAALAQPASFVCARSSATRTPARSWPHAKHKCTPHTHAHNLQASHAAHPLGRPGARLPVKCGTAGR